MLDVELVRTLRETCESSFPTLQLRHLVTNAATTVAPKGQFVTKESRFQTYLRSVIQKHEGDPRHRPTCQVSIA